MYRSAAALASLALLAGSLLALPSAPAPRAVSRSVPSLIAALGSPDFHEREAASRELDLVGTAALPELQREMTRTTDSEVRRRASQLITRLQKRQADELALAPTMVEINARDATLDAIAADLSKQTGYEVVIQAPAKKVTLRTGKVSFWQAIESISDAADLQIASVGGVNAPADPRVASTPALDPVRLPSPDLLPPHVPTSPDGSAASHVDQLKKDLEKIAKARAEVAKEVNAGAKAREAALARIQAEAELRLNQAIRDALLAKQGIAKSSPPLPAAVASRTMQVANPANAIVLEPRKGAKRPATNFGAVRLEAMAMPESAAVADAVAALIQVWTEPRLQWQRMHDVRVRQARDEHGQALFADGDNRLAAGPTVIDGNGVQVVQNVNGGVVIVNNGGGRVVINGNINGRVIVNNGNVIIQGNNITPANTPTVALAANNRQAVVKLQPGDRESASLLELSGLLEAIVKTTPQALVTISDLTQPSEATASGVRLKTGMAIKENDDRYAFDVEIAYNPNEVQAGQAVTSATSPITLRRIGPSQAFNSNGLQVTDESGKSYQFQPRSQSTTHMGNNLMQMKLTGKLVAESKDMGPPKIVRFWGVHNANVDIPFRLANVPALAARK